MDTKLAVKLIGITGKVIGEVIENIKLVDKVYCIISNENALMVVEKREKYDTEGVVKTIVNETGLVLDVDTITALKLDKNEGRLNLCFQLVMKELKEYTTIPVDIIKPLIIFAIKLFKQSIDKK